MRTKQILLANCLIGAYNIDIKRYPLTRLTTMQILEIKVNTILRQTGINLAPYVINPYQGCAMGCLFCYSQFNKTVLKEEKPWGSYVKVKINAPEILEKEIMRLKPKKVLFGSTTECFQPVEKRYRITESILKILNEHNTPYVILSRSLLIVDYIGLLKKGKCEAIYFTVDSLPEKLRIKLEPKAPALSAAIDTAKRLVAEGLNVVLYFCPLLPWLFKAESLSAQIPRLERAEFEFLNLKLAGMDKLLKHISELYPRLTPKYRRLLSDKDFYPRITQQVSDEIRDKLRTHFKHIKIHTHCFEDYFQNKY